MGTRNVAAAQIVSSENQTEVVEQQMAGKETAKNKQKAGKETAKNKQKAAKAA